MFPVDTRALFAEGQVLASGTAGGAGNTVAMTDFYNAGGDFDLGPGTLLYWVVQLDLAAGDELTFELQTDSDDGFATALATIGTLVFAEAAAAGSRKWIAFPSENLQYIRGVVKPTADDGDSIFTSWLSHVQPTSWTSFPDNVPA